MRGVEGQEKRRYIEGGVAVSSNGKKELQPIRGGVWKYSASIAAEKMGDGEKRAKKEATLWPMMMLQMALVAPAFSEVADEGGGCGLVRALRRRRPSSGA